MIKKITLTLAFMAGLFSLQAQYRFAGRVLGFSSEYNAYPGSWCAAQILGAPTVYPQYGDIDGAWTPRNYGKKRDTIMLGFDNNSPIDSILIWETCGKGVVDSLYVKNPGTGKWVLVWGRKGKGLPSSADTMANILRVGFPMTSFNVSEVRIDMAADSATDWPELDAVAIHPQTLTATTWSNQPGKAAQFDGNLSYYRTDMSSMNLVGKDKFTLMCWVNITADTAPDVNRNYRGSAIINDANYFRYGLYHSNVSNGGDSLYAYTSDDSTSSIGIPYAKNTWMHIAMVNDIATYKVYINGDLYKTVKGNSFDSTDNFGLLEFGRNYDYGIGFKGELDEVKAYNRALTASEVLHEKYSIGDATVKNGLVGYWQFNGNSDTGYWNTYTHLTDSMHNGTVLVNTGNLLATKNYSQLHTGIYPNPNTGMFTIKVSSGINGELPVRITDLNGKTVSESTEVFSNGAAHMDMTKLSRGIYLLQVNHTALKFIKE